MLLHYYTMCHSIKIIINNIVILINTKYMYKIFKNKYINKTNIL